MEKDMDLEDIFLKLTEQDDSVNNIIDNLRKTMNLWRYEETKAKSDRDEQ